MSFSSWLRNGKRTAPATSRRTQPSLRQRPRIRPRLESLEDRLVLSTTAIMQTNLVSDDILFTPAQVQDPNLVNPWGLAASSIGAWWVANEGTGTSTVYDTSKSRDAFRSSPLVVNIPHDSPTGIVFNSGTGFKVSENGKTGSSTFLFATADGTISGWNPQVDGNHAIIGVTNPGAIYLVWPSPRLPRQNAAVRGRFRQGHHRCLQSELPIGNETARQIHRLPIAGATTIRSTSRPSVIGSTSNTPRSIRSSPGSQVRAKAPSMSTTPTAGCSSA